MDYDKNYFYNIERNAPFSFLSPITKRSELFKSFVIKLIQYKENHFAISRARWILKKINPHSSLDIGTGNGKLVEKLLERNIDAYGVDISQFQIDNLAPKLKSRVFLAEINKLPFENNKFDVVSAYHVLEHIEENKLQESIREVARVSRHNIIFELPTLECYNVSIDPSHISTFSYKKWLAIMNAALTVEWKIYNIRKPTYLRPFFITFIRN